MRRDAIMAALRRAKIVAALRALGASERTRGAWSALRRRPDPVVALLLGAGVLAMILHWR